MLAGFGDGVAVGVNIDRGLRLEVGLSAASDKLCSSITLTGRRRWTVVRLEVVGYQMIRCWNSRSVPAR